MKIGIFWGGIILLAASQAAAGTVVFTPVSDFGSSITEQCERLCEENKSTYYSPNPERETKTVNACTVEWSHYWTATECSAIGMTADSSADAFHGNGRPYDERSWTKRIVETYRLQRYLMKGGEYEIIWTNWEESQASKELAYQRYPLYRNSSNFIHPELVGESIGWVAGQHRFLGWKRKFGSAGPGTGLLFSPNHVVGLSVLCVPYASVSESMYTGTDYKPATSMVFDGRYECKGTPGDRNSDGVMEYEYGQVPRPTLVRIRNVNSALASAIQAQLGCTEDIVDFSKQNHLMSAPGHSGSNCLNVVASSASMVKKRQGSTYFVGGGYSLGSSQPWPMFRKK